MAGDEGLGAVGDRAFEGLEAGGDVVGRIDRLADVVQQRGEQDRLVVAALVAGQLEDLERVLVEVANGPTDIAPEDLTRLRQRIDDQDLVFRVRVVAREMRERGWSWSL